MFAAFIGGVVVGLALWPASRWAFRKLAEWAGDIEES